MSEDKPSETRYMGLAQLRQEGTWQDHTTGPVITDHAEIAELERAREIADMMIDRWTRFKASLEAKPD